MSPDGEPARLVLHGHFYQPPRENPWTEELDPEASAAPWANWNERITAECYRANGWAPVVEDGGRVLALLNSYERLSFDLGPTLAAWLADAAPDVLERIVAGDRVGGGAVAAAYNHVILPLATERDIRTQVRWGRVDFETRFGRVPEGIWLPETAVDDVVLRVLAEEGVAFTILAPGQAAAVRPLGARGEEGWVEVGDVPLDTSRPYRWVDPDRPELGVDVLFYDGPLASELAFGEAARSPTALLAGVRRAAEVGDGDLVTAATDGETFGHHQRYGDRALAWALAVEARRAGVVVTTAPAALAATPPAMQVRVARSAWSCAHGVERWRGDCGCSTGGPEGTSQAWREHLRAALDVVRDAVADALDGRGRTVLGDPWAARDAYGAVVVGRTSVEAFAAAHVAGGGADEDALVEALTLLEAARSAMLMYTSCGWFFWDLAGLETVQVLRYAARALDLLAAAGEEPPTAEVLEVLTKAESNVAAEGSGADVWRRRVEPARVDAARVAATLAVGELLDRPPPGPLVGGFEVGELERTVATRGSTSLGLGRVSLVDRRTRRRSDLVWAALELGGLGLTAAVRRADPARDAAEASGLREAFAAGAPATGLLRRIVEGFGPTTYGEEALLPAPAAPADPSAPTPVVVDGPRSGLAAALQGAFDEAVDAALAGRGDEAVEVALDTLEAAATLGLDLDTARALARVHDALAGPVGQRRSDLGPLGAGLGLAVDRLGAPPGPGGAPVV